MKLLDINEVSGLLKMTPQTLRNKLCRGDDVPPSFKLPGCRRRYWRQEDVDQWLAESVETGDMPDSENIRRGRPRKIDQVARKRRQA